MAGRGRKGEEEVNPRSVKAHPSEAHSPQRSGDILCELTRRRFVGEV